MTRLDPALQVNRERPKSFSRSRMGLMLAVVALVAVALWYRFRGGQPGPESDDLKPVYAALQVRWPDPLMRVGRRQLGARKAVVAWFVSNEYVDRAKTEKEALTKDAVEVVRRALPNALDVTHVCVLFAKEDHSGMSFRSMGAGSCSAR